MTADNGESRALEDEVASIVRDAIEATMRGGAEDPVGRAVDDIVDALTARSGNLGGGRNVARLLNEVRLDGWVQDHRPEWCDIIDRLRESLVEPCDDCGGTGRLRTSSWDAEGFVCPGHGPMVRVYHHGVLLSVLCRRCGKQPLGLLQRAVHSDGGDA